MQNYAITSQVVTITPTLAKDILNGNTKNRPLNTNTVLDYAAQMEKGLWKLNGEPIIIGKSGCLVDGQHRLEACVLADKSFQTIVIYNVDDDSFATIDTGRIRTAKDIFSIDNIPSAAQSAASVTAYYNLKYSSQSYNRNNGLRQIKMSKQELLDFTKKHTELVNNVISIASKCNNKLRILTQSQIGAYIFYLVLEKNHPLNKVADFFYELFGVTEPVHKTVTTLRDCLIRYSLKQSLITPSTRNIYIIKSWNAYITGKEISRLSYQKEVEGKIEFV